LRQGGFRVPDAERAHGYLWLRLSNSGHPDVNKAGANLNHLRSMRNWADYDFDQPIDEAVAIEQVKIAGDIVQLLHQLANEPVIRDRVVDAMKNYERDVLHEVTWHP
jgi:hypothetical protein